MSKFRNFIEANLYWFNGGTKETEATLNEAEQHLSVKLPEDVRWLLKANGYGIASGISSLEETVADTLAARKHLNLPANLIVLYNHHDGGVILLDTNADPVTRQHKVYNTGWESVPDQLEREIIYSSYLEYIMDELDSKKSFAGNAE
jgi:hypothetical protein